MVSDESSGKSRPKRDMHLSEEQKRNILKSDLRTTNLLEAARVELQLLSEVEKDRIHLPRGIDTRGTQNNGEEQDWAEDYLSMVYIK